MLIPVEKLQKHGWNPKGVIHVGAHMGEEQEIYDSIGVKRTLWFEAIYGSYLAIEEKFEHRDDVRVVNAALSDKIGLAKFHVTNNLASSSLLPLKLHKKHHPKIYETSEIDVFTEVLDDIFHNVLMEDINDFDMMNLDVQGAELMVLKGAGDMLKSMKWIYTEVNREELYEDCCMVEEIDDYLGGFGFIREQTEWTPKGWGDSLYTKNYI